MGEYGDVGEGVYYNYVVRVGLCAGRQEEIKLCS